MNKIIEDTEIFVKDFMKSYDCSHDFEHVLRVRDTAVIIAKTENMSINDIFEIELGALTHDVSDHKYSNGTITQEKILREFFKNKLHEDVINNIINIAINVSLSKEVSSVEKIFCKKLFCVQDADRLDSLGSIGISRYFAYGFLQNNSSVRDIYINMKNRTDILIKHMKTKYGKEKAEKKYNIIKMVLEDFNDTL